ncbi:MAG: DUF2975 domain-containing protein [Acetanaerobacterium sp.]
MKQAELARWLQWMVAVIALAGLAMCFLIAPALGSDAARMNPEFKYMFWPCLVFIWISAVPFYLALWKTWQICGDISRDNSFSWKNAERLKFISKLALFDCLLYMAAAIVLFIMNLLHPSILLMVLFIIVVGISIAAVSAVLSHLVEKAGALRQENDLTI